ncbi:hypothetical protein BBBOND_0401070 [Babesia bigemina]|uniref:Uncharacterized protein n=1 Tax=Babesia bigemina TaxID=5866 RepID=A0A061DEP0_BABBI|nr:hypothetical protein BBBOND_0401070 [Babesia bigemina]CDR97615.1 hypothetical protein BBBOND_0401070 [Babesia bigemina]|eukprot:XP_012769801.1 hypothetical protein BBBOND_0401070 [Babesia bigemina]
MDLGRHGSYPPPHVLPWVVRLRRAEQRLHAKQHRSYLQRGAPLVLQDVQAYPAELVDVRVVYAGEESHLRRLHWVLLGEKQLEFVHTSLVGCALRSQHPDVEVPVVSGVELGPDAGCCTNISVSGEMTSTYANRSPNFRFPSVSVWASLCVL